MGNNETSVGRGSRSDQVLEKRIPTDRRSHETQIKYYHSRNKEREKEDSIEKHEAELKLYKQKVKHLMYEHQSNLSETKAEHMVALKMAQDDHTVQENELINDKKDLKKMYKEQEIARLDEIRELKLVRSDCSTG